LIKLIAYPQFLIWAHIWISPNLLIFSGFLLSFHLLCWWFLFWEIWFLLIFIINLKGFISTDKIFLWSDLLSFLNSCSFLWISRSIWNLHPFKISLACKTKSLFCKFLLLRNCDQIQFFFPLFRSFFRLNSTWH